MMNWAGEHRVHNVIEENYWVALVSTEDAVPLKDPCGMVQIAEAQIMAQTMDFIPEQTRFDFCNLKKNHEAHIDCSSQFYGGSFKQWS